MTWQNSDGNPPSNPEEQKQYMDIRAKERANERRKYLNAKKERTTGKEQKREINDLTKQMKNELSELIPEITGDREEASPKENVYQIKKDLVKNEENIEPNKKIARLRTEASSRLRRFMNIRRGIMKKIARLEEMRNQMIRDVHHDPDLRESNVAWENISKIEDSIRIGQRGLDALPYTSPEAFLAHWLIEIRKWKDDFNRHEKIDTPAMRKTFDKMLDNTKRKMEQTNGIVTLFGPTGSGKTVTAKKLAEALSKTNTDHPELGYYFVGAHSKMTPEDILLRQAITIDATDPSKVPDLIRLKQDYFRQTHLDIVGDELNKALESIEDVVRRQSSEKTFQTKAVMESVLRAAHEGKIVIIDEFNYLPPETLASLNDLLSAKCGTSCQILIGDTMQNVTKKEGFGVIFTGNKGKEYIKRQKFCPALINRILSGSIEYGSPSQNVDGSFYDSILTQKDVLNQKHISERSLFQIGLSHVLDMKGHLLKAPTDTFDQIWQLSQTFKMVQLIAAGAPLRDFIKDKHGEFSNIIPAVSFSDVFLSFRNLNQIIREWKMDNYNKPLDWYIYELVIKPARIFNEKESAYLFALFRFHKFFTEEPWKNITVDFNTWNVNDPIENTHRDPEYWQKPALKDFMDQEVAEAASGMLMPDFSSIHLKNEERDTKEQERIVNMKKMETNMRQYKREFEKYWYVKKVCP